MNLKKKEKKREDQIRKKVEGEALRNPNKSDQYTLFQTAEYSHVLSGHQPETPDFLSTVITAIPIKNKQTKTTTTTTTTKTTETTTTKMHSCISLEINTCQTQCSVQRIFFSLPFSCSSFLSGIFFQTDYLLVIKANTGTRKNIF